MSLENKGTAVGILWSLRWREVPETCWGVRVHPPPGKKNLNTYLNGANVKYFERIKARIFITEYIEKYYTRTSITNMERYVR